MNFRMRAFFIFVVIICYCCNITWGEVESMASHPPSVFADDSNVATSLTDLDDSESGSGSGSNSLYDDPVSSINIDYLNNGLVFQFRRSIKSDNTEIETRRRSALDKNFMRFGRSDKNLMRFGRSNKDATKYTRGDKNLMRFGRSDKNLLRFGRPESKNLLRFGRGDKNLMRFGRNDRSFLRFGRSGANLMRFGRGGKQLMRFGRNGNIVDDSTGIDAQESVYEFIPFEALIPQGKNEGNKGNKEKKNNPKVSNRRSDDIANSVNKVAGSGNERFADRNLMRFGRSKADNSFMRFGKKDNSFLRFGKSDKNSEFGHLEETDNTLGSYDDFDELLNKMSEKIHNDLKKQNKTSVVSQDFKINYPQHQFAAETVDENENLNNQKGNEYSYFPDYTLEEL